MADQDQTVGASTEHAVDRPGGDPPCWAHLDDALDLPLATGATVTDLTSIVQTGRSGVIWSQPGVEDLNVNLVDLNPGDAIDPHYNREVDVVVVVLDGAGTLTTNGASVEIDRDTIASIQRGAERSIAAGDRGLRYLSIHRRRSSVQISPRS